MIWRDEAALLAWLAGCIAMGLCAERFAAWRRRRRITRTAFSRLDYAGQIVKPARRFLP